MIRAKNYAGLLLALMLPAFLAASPQHSDQHHDHKPDPQRADAVNRRGDHVMGFSHEKTTHHFRLTSDGGMIEVTANDPSDAASQEQIRTHLSHVAKLFKEGDFTKPMLTHGETPPGVTAMTRLKADISYAFEAIDRGARVRIVSANVEAVGAIHEFLRYQIKDHQTGDSLEPDKKSATDK